MLSVLIPFLVACGTSPAAPSDAPVEAPVVEAAPAAPAPPAPAAEPALRTEASLPTDVFVPLKPGLELGIFVSPVTSGISDERIHVLRADPANWALDLGMASEEGTPGKPADEWLAHQGDWVAVINASMFLPDYRSSVFQLKHGDHVNQASFKSNASNVLSFGETGAEIVDINCDDWARAQATHTSFVQSYRLVDCKGAPTWGHKGGRKWSHALIGSDTEGRILFIHARSPFTTRQFTEILQGLPIGLHRLQYAEGGPEASLYVRTDDFELKRIGSYETGFNEDDTNSWFWNLPNVVGIRPRPAASPTK